MSAILRDDPPELARRDIPAALVGVVRRCLEKRPEERFQSARDVAFALEAMSGARAGIGFSSSRQSRRPLLVGAAAVLGVVSLAALAAWLRPAPPAPRVTRSTQITDDLVAKGDPVTDGARVYFNESPRADRRVLAQVVARGGDVAQIATPFPDARVVDVSPDGAELLVVGSREPPPAGSPPEVWTVPVLGGAPHRVGDIRAIDAAWSPDGRNIVYTAGQPTSEVYLASSEGSSSRSIWKAPGEARFPAWSPDGRRLRLTLFVPNEPMAIWEIGADGQDPHPLLPAFEVPQNSGRWTPDGKYFVFTAWGGLGRTQDLWVLREGTTWFSRRAREPVQAHARSPQLLEPCSQSRRQEGLRGGRKAARGAGSLRSSLGPVRPLSLRDLRARCRVLARRPVGRLRHLPRGCALAKSRGRERPPPAQRSRAPCQRAALVSRRQAALVHGHALFPARPHDLELPDLRRRGAAGARTDAERSGVGGLELVARRRDPRLVAAERLQ